MRNLNSGDEQAEVMVEGRVATAKQMWRETKGDCLIEATAKRRMAAAKQMRHSIRGNGRREGGYDQTYVTL